MVAEPGPTVSAILLLGSLRGRWTGMRRNHGSLLWRTWGQAGAWRRNALGGARAHHLSPSLQQRWIVARVRNRGGRQNLEGWLRHKTAPALPKPKPPISNESNRPSLTIDGFVSRRLRIGDTRCGSPRACHRDRPSSWRPPGSRALEGAQYLRESGGMRLLGEYRRAGRGVEPQAQRQGNGKSVSAR